MYGFRPSKSRNFRKLQPRHRLREEIHRARYNSLTVSLACSSEPWPLHRHHPDGALVGNSAGKPWNGDYLFNSGNLKLDLLHNFFLEAGATTHNMRVYEMTDNPAAREMIGYLLCRGGVHKEAYAEALEDLTGVEMTKLLPIRDTPNDELPEAKKYLDQGYHRTVYRFSPEYYTELGKICNGAQVDTGEEREVAGGPPERTPILNLPELPRVRLGCCGGGRSRNRQQD